VVWGMVVEWIFLEKLSWRWVTWSAHTPF